MMAAAQPFLSGAISKTVNLPESTTVEQIAEVYSEGWKLGLKALAIYRDGSKTAQALRTDAGDKKGEGKDKDKEADEAKPKDVVIDFDGILDRQVKLPVGPGQYGGLWAGDERVFYASNPMGGLAGPIGGGIGAIIGIIGAIRARGRQKRISADIHEQ